MGDRAIGAIRAIAHENSEGKGKLGDRHLGAVVAKTA